MVNMVNVNVFSIAKKSDDIIDMSFPELVSTKDFILKF